LSGLDLRPGGHSEQDAESDSEKAKSSPHIRSVSKEWNPELEGPPAPAPLPKLLSLPAAAGGFFLRLTRRSYRQGIESYTRCADESNANPPEPPIG